MTAPATPRPSGVNVEESRWVGLLVVSLFPESARRPVAGARWLAEFIILTEVVSS